MNHEDIKILISAYIDGEVTSSQKDIVENHMISCPSCQKEFDEFKKVSACLKRVPLDRLSPDVELNIKARLGSTKEKIMNNKNYVFPVGAIVMTIAVLSFTILGVKQNKIQKADDVSKYFTAGDTKHSGITQEYEPYYMASELKPVAQSAARQTQQFQSTYSVDSLAGGITLAEESSRIINPADDWQRSREFNTEEYDKINETGFRNPVDDPLSTFSIDVDTASYSNIRRFLNQGQLPPEDAVRIEEMINYFSYDYPAPESGKPFSITTELGVCPWNQKHQLALIGLQGQRLDAAQLSASNLVFLIDVSGSMNDPNKLPLLQSAYRMMIGQLNPDDRVSIVVYAGAAGLVLEGAPGNQQERILQAVEQLRAGGSTAGSEGIELAYQIARRHFIANGNNRVILATDGDFNVGVSSDGALVRLIESYREQGVFLTVLGFGMGNYKDSKMEKLADSGNGNYFYIDNINEARKVLVEELGSTLFTIAKDVKIQVEFNPAVVEGYRLIGYENRRLNKEDFNDDRKDAGELGAGHSVTALYEIIPKGENEHNPNAVDPLVYQKKQQAANTTDVMTVKLRYKKPSANESQLITHVVHDSKLENTMKSDNFQWASAVAEFGLLLTNSTFKAGASFDAVLQRARQSRQDPFGYRSEFINLVDKAKSLNHSKVMSSDIQYNERSNSSGKRQK